jgi:hypothetical protein
MDFAASRMAQDQTTAADWINYSLLFPAVCQQMLAWRNWKPLEAASADAIV